MTQVEHFLALIEALKAANTRRRTITFSLETITFIETSGHAVPKSTVELQDLIQRLESRIERLLS
jgi:hypothetical protein